MVSKRNGGTIATIGATGLCWYSAEYDGGGTDFLNIQFFKEGGRMKKAAMFLVVFFVMTISLPAYAGDQPAAEFCDPKKMEECKVKLDKLLESLYVALLPFGPTVVEWIHDLGPKLADGARSLLDIHGVRQVHTHERSIDIP